MNLPMRSKFRLVIGACLTLALASCSTIKPLPNFPSVPVQSTSGGQQCPDLSGFYSGDAIRHRMRKSYNSNEIEVFNNKAWDPASSFWWFKESSTPFSAFGQGFRKKLYPVNTKNDLSKEVDIEFVRWIRLNDFVYRVEAYSDEPREPYVYNFDWSSHSSCQSGELIVNFKARDGQEMVGNYKTLEERYYRSTDGSLIVDEIYYRHQSQFLIPTGIRSAERTRTEFISIPEQTK